jgi:hypothetical protein
MCSRRGRYDVTEEQLCMLEEAVQNDFKEKLKSCVTQLKTLCCDYTEIM